MPNARKGSDPLQLCKDEGRICLRTGVTGLEHSDVLLLYLPKAMKMVWVWNQANCPWVDALSKLNLLLLFPLGGCPLPRNSYTSFKTPAQSTSLGVTSQVSFLTSVLQKYFLQEAKFPAGRAWV